MRAMGVFRVLNSTHELTAIRWDDVVLAVVPFALSRGAAPPSRAAVRFVEESQRACRADDYD
jgi:hypothetical protein